MQSPEDPNDTAARLTYGSRAEHLAWAKRRALELLDAGQPKEACLSIASDLQKHPDTRLPVAAIGPMALLGALTEPGEVRKWIEGFA